MPARAAADQSGAAALVGLTNVPLDFGEGRDDTTQSARQHMLLVSGLLLVQLLRRTGTTAAVSDRRARRSPLDRADRRVMFTAPKAASAIVRTVQPTCLDSIVHLSDGQDHFTHTPGVMETIWPGLLVEGRRYAQ